MSLGLHIPFEPLISLRCGLNYVVSNSNGYFLRKFDQYRYSCFFNRLLEFVWLKKGIDLKKNFKSLSCAHIVGSVYMIIANLVEMDRVGFSRALHTDIVKEIL